MSLLADLLSKAKHEETRADVPPDLTKLVKEGTKNRTSRKKILLTLVVALVVVLAGFAAIYFADLYITSSPTSQRSATRAIPPVAQPESKPPPPSAPVTTPDTPDVRVSTPKTGSTSTLPVTSASPSSDRSGHESSVKRVPGARATKDSAVKPSFPLDKPSDRIVHTKEKLVPRTEKTTSAIKSEKDTYLYTARTYEQNKFFREAIVNYQKALALDGENYIVMNNVAGLLLKLNAFEDALFYAKKALSVRKDYVPALTNLGLAHIYLGRAKEGEEALTKARSLDPTNQSVLLNLALLSERLQNYDKAIMLFTTLARMENTHGYLGLARVAERQGRIADAEKGYRDLLAMNNVDSETKKQAGERLSAILRTR